MQKAIFWLISSFAALSVYAADNEAESRRLFTTTTWGSVYTCAAAGERLHPENAKAEQLVMQTMEREFVIPKAHGPSFRKLAAAKVEVLSSKGHLAKFAADSCPRAKVGYMGTVSH